MWMQRLVETTAAITADIPIDSKNPARAMAMLSVPLPFVTPVALQGTRLAAPTRELRGSGRRCAHQQFHRGPGTRRSDALMAGAFVGGFLSRNRGRNGVPAAAVALPKTAPEMKSELLDILSGDWDSSRVEAAQRVEDLVEALIQGYKESTMSDQEAQRLLQGKWQLLSTFTPGQAAANLFSLKSWQEYVFGKGPSPVQAAAFTNNAVQRVYQVLDLSVSPKRWYNVIDAMPTGIICLEADLTSQDANVRFQWTGGQIVINRPPWTPWSQEDLDEPIRLPYPVPFALLGDRARGIFETVYLDDDLRISRGSKSGSVFVLRRESKPLPMEDMYFSR